MSRCCHLADSVAHSCLGSFSVVLNPTPAQRMKTREAETAITVTGYVAEQRPTLEDIHCVSDIMMKKKPLKGRLSQLAMFNSG